MTEIWKKASEILIGVCICSAAVLFIMFGKEAAESAGNAVMLCLNVMIPSLYAFMVISKLLVSTDSFTFIGKYLSWFSERVFRIRGDVFSVILISQVSGYPVGAGLLSQMYKCGMISRDEAEKMLCFCIAPGPAYIMTVCSRLFPREEGLWLTVFTAVLCSDLLPLLFTAPFRKKPSHNYAEIKPHIDARLFTEAVGSSAASMTMICAIIIFAAAFLGIAAQTGLLGVISRFVSMLTMTPAVEIYPFVRSFFEISNLLDIICGTGLVLPCIAAMLSFGGLCVHLQIMSVAEGLSAVRAVIFRIPAAIISFCVCRAIMPEYFGLKAVSVMAEGNITMKHGEYSPILSIFLLIMTILILSQKTIVKNEKV